MTSKCQSSVKLSSIATYSIGLTYAPEDVNSDGIIVLRSGNIQDGSITLEDIVRVNKPIKDSLYVKKGNILMCSRNGSASLVGKTAIVEDYPERMTFGAFMTLIKTDIPEYINAFFSTPSFRYQVSMGKSSTMNQITQKMLDSIELPLVSVSEQEQFAEIVRQADKSKFDGFKSQFLEWFGNPFLSPKNGESVSITDVADIVLGTTPNSKIKEYWDGELKWITPAEIEEESFIISDTVRHITEDGRNSANLTLLPVGSVLFSTRAPIGKVAIAGEEMYCNQGFKNFICKPELNNVFLYYTLRLNKEYLVSLGTGTTFKELSKKIVESIKISVPAKEQQEQFERVFRQSDKSKYYEINKTSYGIF